MREVSSPVRLRESPRPSSPLLSQRQCHPRYDDWRVRSASLSAAVCNGRCSLCSLRSPSPRTVLQVEICQPDLPVDNSNRRIADLQSSVDRPSSSAQRHVSNRIETTYSSAKSL